MKNPVLLLPLSLMLMILACQPGKLLKKDNTAAADSVLYYEQKDLDDPFLDTVFQEQDQPVTISRTLYPPPVPPEPVQRLREIEGFRVQIFAGIDSLNAMPVLGEAEGLTGDSVYFFLDRGLFKIQIGDYQFRYKADSAKTYFRQNGFPGAWVVQRPVLIPIAADSLMAEEQPSDSDSSDLLIGESEGSYKIQVMAVNDEAKARLIAADLRSEENYNAFYEHSGNLYKIFVGYFKSETKAREVLRLVRDQGYPDAWLVR